MFPSTWQKLSKIFVSQRDVELAGVEPASSEAPLRISFTGLVSFSKLTKLYHLFFDWDMWCDSVENASSDLKGIGPKSSGLLIILQSGTVNPYSRNYNFLFPGCCRPTLRLLLEQLQLPFEELVPQGWKMDFRHLLFYIGYLRVSNANSACINSKNFDLLSIPFSPICFLEPQRYRICFA